MVAGLEKTIAAPATKYLEIIKKRIFLYPLLGDVVLSIAGSILYLAEIRFLLDNEYTLSNISFLLMTSYWGMALLCPFAGYLVEKYNYRRILTIALLLYSVVPILFFFFIENFMLLALLGFTAGMAVALSQTAGRVFTLSTLPPDLISRFYIGIMIFSGLGWLGYPVGMSLYGVKTILPFIAGALGIIAAAFLFFFGVRKIKLKSASDLTILSGWKTIARIMNRRTVRLFVMISIVRYGGAIYLFAIPVHLLKISSAEEMPSVGLLVLLSFVIFLVSSVMLQSTDRIKLSHSRLVFAAMTLISVVIALFFRNDPVKIICWGLFMAAEAYMSNLIFSNLREFIRVESGLENSVIMFVMNVTGGVSLLIATLMLQSAAVIEILFKTYPLLPLLGMIITGSLPGESKNAAGPN